MSIVEDAGGDDHVVVNLCAELVVQPGVLVDFDKPDISGEGEVPLWSEVPFVDAEHGVGGGSGRRTEHAGFDGGQPAQVGDEAGGMKLK